MRARRTCRTRSASISSDTLRTNGTDRALRTDRTHRTDGSCGSHWTSRAIETGNTLQTSGALRARRTCGARSAIIPSGTLRTRRTDQTGCTWGTHRTGRAHRPLRTDSTCGTSWPQRTVISWQTLWACRALCTSDARSARGPCRTLRAGWTLRARNAVECELRNRCGGNRLPWQSGASDAHLKVHLGTGKCARKGKINTENTVNDGIIRLADGRTKLGTATGRIPQRESQIVVAIDQHAVLLDLALIDKIRQLGSRGGGERGGSRASPENDGNGENKILDFHGVQFPCWASKPFWKIRSEMMVCWCAATTA